MKLHWYKINKSPYAFELGMVVMAIDNAHYFAMITKQHPHKWNRDTWQMDIDFTKIEFHVSVPDMGVVTVCETQELAHTTVRQVLKQYADRLNSFANECTIPDCAPTSPVQYGNISE